MRKQLIYFLLCILGALSLQGLNAKEPSPPQIPAISDIDLLNLNDEVKTLLDEKIRPFKTKKGKTEALHDLLFSSEKLNIRYDFSATQTAQETFDLKKGNCLSQAVLFVAAARYLGLRTRFQSVENTIPWEKRENFYLVPEHLNAVVALPGKRRATIEFPEPEIDIKGKPRTKIVKDQQVLADYYNNKGVEALNNNELYLALGYFQKSIEVRPRSAFAWSNKGAAHKLLKDFDEAEYAFLKAHKFDKRNKSIVINLYTLYRETGQDEKAAKYFSHVKKYQRARKRVAKGR